VAVSSALIALALGALSRMQLLSDEALRLTTASQQATASAVRLTRCTTEVSPPTPQPGTAASHPVPPRSCP
jgi:hypothetical protein